MVGVRHVLLAYEAALNVGLKTAIFEREDVVEDDIGRESGVRFAQVDHVVIVRSDGPVLVAGTREGKVGIPAEPVHRLPSTFQFNASAVTLAAILIAGNHLADVVELTREHILVVVEHIVEVHASREAATAVLIAHLNILQAFGLEVLDVVVLIIVAHGLAVRHGIRGVEAVVAVEFVVEAHLGVEEVEIVVRPQALCLATDIPVGRVLQAIAHVAVLQICETAQAAQKLPFGLCVNVEVGFPGAVSVVFMADGQIVERLLHPEHLAKVVADVLVPSAAEDSLEAAVGMVVERGDGAIEIVLHFLLAHEVGLELLRGEAVVLQVLIALVLFVVTITACPVQGYVEVERRQEALRPKQLIVLLVIDIVLVVVVMHVALIVPVFTAGVIAATIKALLVFRSVVPSVVGRFGIVEGDKLDHGVLAHVACLQEIAVETRSGAVQIAVRGQVRQATLHGPVSAEQSSAEAHSFLVSQITTCATIKAEEWLGGQIFGLHIERSTKGASTIGRCARTALDLHALHA